MTKENSKIKSVLKSLFLTSIEKLIKSDSSLMTNLSVQFDSEAGEVQVYDEQERLLQKKVIFDWVGANVKEGPFMSKMLSVLNQVIETIVLDRGFEHQLFAKPFVVQLTDEEGKVIADIYTIEEDDLMQEDELLKGLDEELDLFLEKLFSDVK